MKPTFEAFWASYWQNRTDTTEHTIARSIARDAWWAGRKSRRYQPHPATARRAIEAAEDAYDAIERAIYADLRAKVEGLPTWDGYYAPVVVLADVLALFDEEARP